MSEYHTHSHSIAKWLYESLAGTIRRLDQDWANNLADNLSAKAQKSRDALQKAEDHRHIFDMEVSQELPNNGNLNTTNSNQFP